MKGHRKVSSDSSDSDTTSSGEDEDARPGGLDQKSSWVQCDRPGCNKWRRVPAALAASLTDDTPWYCEMNPDKAFNHCSAPQELSTEEINAMEISTDGEEELAQEDLAIFEERACRRRIPAVWQLIRDNVLTHRKRKVQEEDDVMICNCKPPWRGGDCCGADCINRMLCVECVAGFCPSEDKCTNQAFTRKQYAKLEVRRAGAKGFGLFALEPIVTGQFIIEYIGEVLEEEEYLRRKDFYAEVGQRHYYFMNIGNGEVIDACRKGNRARFINHSCDPNCETQKWLAGGELAIGLFAVKDIGVGEELTFDYNFERYGDKPIRCYCASKTCRRFIGGTQDNYDDSIIPVDPEDASNDWQPIMLVDNDMDWAMRALLDWRVGVSWEPEKESAILNKLERICKARTVPWRTAHFYGDAPVPSMTDAQAMPEPNPAEFGKDGGKGEGAEAKKRSTRRSAAEKAEKSEKAEKAEKTAGKRAAGGRAGTKETGNGNEVKEEEEAVKEEVKPVARGPAKAALKKAKAEAAEIKAEPAEEKVVGSVPHAAAMSAVTKTPLPARKRGAAKAESKTEASNASASTALVSGTRKKEAASDRDTTGPVTSSQISAMTDIKDSVLQKARPAATTASRETGAMKDDQDKAGFEAQSREESDSDEETGINVSKPLPVAPPAKRRAWGSQGVKGVRVQGFRRRSEIDRRLETLLGPSGRMRDASKTNIIKVLRMFNLCDIGPQRVQRTAATASPAPDVPMTDIQPTAMPAPVPPPAHANDACSGNAATLASRMSNTQPETGHEAAAPVRESSIPLFPTPDADALSVAVPPTAAANPNQQPSSTDQFAGQGTDQQGPAVKQEPFSSEMAAYSTPAGLIPAAPSPAPALPAPMPLPRERSALNSNQPIVMTARQRARMADLSLLLDVILKTSSATVRKEFIACGVLNQLHQAIGRNFSKEYTVILRKILRVMEALPLTSDDLFGTRTAHGTLADTLQELVSNPDYDVRNKSIGLLKKYPLSACQDTLLLQRLAAPQGRRVPTGFSPAINPATVQPQPTPVPPSGPGRPPLIRGSHSMADLQQAGPSPYTGVPPSPFPGAHQQSVPPESPLHFDVNPEGTAVGEPQFKRRKRGFSDGPIPQVYEGSYPQPTPSPPLYHPPPHLLPPHPAAARGMAMPYSFRHGSALMNYDNEPPPPPLDAEELFELLLVPTGAESALRKIAIPPAIAVDVPPNCPHGEPSDMEVLFAVGVYDTKWEAAAQDYGKQMRRVRREAKHGKSSREAVRDMDRGSDSETLPMSPLRTEPMCYSPVRDEILEQTKTIVTTAQEKSAAQEKPHQQHPAMNGYPPAQFPGFKHTSSRSDLQGFAGHLSETPHHMGLGRSPYNIDTRHHPRVPTRAPSPGLAPCQPTPESHHLHPHHRVAGSHGFRGFPSPAVHSAQLAAQPPTPAHTHQTPNASADQPVNQQQGTEWSRPMKGGYPDSWDEPDAEFERYVHEAVRYRLGKYVTQPDHPNRISSDEAHMLLKKIMKEVMEKERQAFETRKGQGLFKLIEKRKVEVNMKEFVRLSIRRYHASGGGVHANTTVQPVQTAA